MITQWKDESFNENELENRETLVNDEKLNESDAERETERSEERVVEKNADSDARVLLALGHLINAANFEEHERNEHTIHHEQCYTPH